MGSEERVRQSRRKVALALQKAKEEKALREIDSIGRLVDDVVRSRSNPPPPDPQGGVIQGRKP